MSRERVQRTAPSSTPEVEIKANKGAFNRSSKHPDKAPYLAVSGSYTAVVFYKGTKNVRVAWIENSVGSSLFIKARTMPAETFERDYDVVTNYDVKRAAEMYVRMAEKWGSGPAVLEALRAVASGAPLDEESLLNFDEGEDEMAAKKKAKAKMPAKKASEGKSVKASNRMQRTDKLHKTGDNPWREGTKGHENYKKIRDGMTVQAFIDAGGALPHLQYDIKRGKVKLEKVAA